MEWNCCAELYCYYSNRSEVQFSLRMCQQFKDTPHLFKRWLKTRCLVRIYQTIRVKKMSKLHLQCPEMTNLPLQSAWLHRIVKATTWLAICSSPQSMHWQCPLKSSQGKQKWRIASPAIAYVAFEIESTLEVDWLTNGWSELWVVVVVFPCASAIIPRLHIFGELEELLHFFGFGLLQLSLPSLDWNYRTIFRDLCPDKILTNKGSCVHWKNHSFI